MVASTPPPAYDSIAAGIIMWQGNLVSAFIDAWNLSSDDEASLDWPSDQGWSDEEDDCTRIGTYYYDPGDYSEMSDGSEQFEAETDADADADADADERSGMNSEDENESLDSGEDESEDKSEDVPSLVFAAGRYRGLEEYEQILPRTGEDESDEGVLARGLSRERTVSAKNAAPKPDRVKSITTMPDPVKSDETVAWGSIDDVDLDAIDDANEALNELVPPAGAPSKSAGSHSGFSETAPKKSPRAASNSGGKKVRLLNELAEPDEVAEQKAKDSEKSMILARPAKKAKVDKKASSGVYKWPGHWFMGTKGSH